MMVSEKNLPVLGLVITQKNEAAILNHNIEYHRYMGISHFYIFDDDSTDESMNTIPDREGVYKFYKTDFSNIPKEMNSVKQKALDGNWMARQILNTYKALKLAKGHGIDWLFFIDADELVYFGNQKVNSFCQDFAEIEDDIEVVHFNEVLEVAQNGGSNDNIFISATYFKTVEYDNTRERRILDPMKEEMITLKGFLGHRAGKQAARVDADLYPVNSHKFKKLNQDNPKILRCGQIYHYHGCSFSEFLKQNSIPHPSHFVYGGEVPYYPKLFWKDLVINSGKTKEELRVYFEKWIMFSDEEIVHLLEQSKNGNPVLIECTIICRIWEEITEKIV